MNGTKTRIFVGFFFSKHKRILNETGKEKKKKSNAFSCNSQLNMLFYHSNAITEL